MMEKGIIQIYTGNGKGKTTAALGLAVRAAGAGLNVVFFQFLKQGNFDFSEEKALKGLRNIKIVRFEEKSPLLEKHINIKQLKKQVSNDIKEVFNAIDNGKFDVAVLDEFTHVLNLGLVKEDHIIDKLKNKPDNVEIVITGRNAGKELIKIAGLVTEMKEIKHPFKKGMKARKGIEY